MEDAELRLFIEQAGWIAPRLPDPTRRGLVCWLGAYLSEEAGRRVARLLPLDHAVQLRAEEAVIALLERRLSKLGRQYEANEVIGRDVDWPQTLERAAGMAPTVYLQRRRCPVPDRSCIGALAALARTWLVLLQLGDGERHRRREQRLAETLRRLGPVTGPGVLSQRVARNLSKFDPVAEKGVNDIWEVLRFWSDQFDRSDATSLMRIGRALRSDSANNPDNLLEVSATLSICRAACQLTESCIPKQRWEVEWRVAGARRAELVLRAGPLTCTLYKGKPHSDPLQEDRLNACLRLMGLEVRGNQPDINLRFERSDCRGAIYALGDAKRNWTGDGLNYLRTAVEVAAAYAHSYGHLIGASRSPGEHGFCATVHPAVTLFCRRSVQRVVGVESAAEIVERLRAAPDLPPIVAFDLERHFGPQDAEWSSPILSAWFARVSRDADRALLAGRGVR